MNKRELRQHLTTVFNKEEMRMFCGRLGIRFDDLGGSSFEDKASSLIGRVEREDRLPELVFELVRERPHLEATYRTYLFAQDKTYQDRLGWLDRMAGGEGRVIEEPPTMRWDSELNPQIPDSDEE